MKKTGVTFTGSIRFLNKTKLSDKSYSYVTDIKNLSKGDLVVCDTSYGLSLGIFQEYLEDDKSKEIASKWIIGQVDTTDHEKRVALERIEEESETLNKQRQNAIIYSNVYKILAED